MWKYTCSPLSFFERHRMCKIIHIGGFVTRSCTVYNNNSVKGRENELYESKVYIYIYITKIKLV